MSKSGHLPGARSWVSRREVCLACLAHVLGGRTLRPLDDVEFDCIALGQGLEAAALNGTVVHEAVFGAVIRRDEAEPFRVVEPLHFAGRTHSELPEEALVEGAERAEP